MDFLINSSPVIVPIEFSAFCIVDLLRCVEKVYNYTVYEYIFAKGCIRLKLYYELQSLAY